MRNIFNALVAALFMTMSATFNLYGQGVDFNRTLRVDYIFSGTDKETEIAVGELRELGEWAGRRYNLDKLPVAGNGRLVMSSNGGVLYTMSFSTLFQEWQATEEATRVRKAFENVFLLPMPAQKAEILVELYDLRGVVRASLKHEVDPSDILIRPATSAPEHKYIFKGGGSDKCIDVAIVAEGYTKKERKLFYRDAKAAVDAILSHEPFASMKEHFNFVAVALESEDSGVSIPGKGEWKNTAVGSNFDTFYMDRYLTTLQLKKMHDALAGLPYEHLVILANTDNYGGGGVYNSYTLTTAHHKAFAPVVVHEFGHSFGALADEYYYDDMFVQYYYPDVEPWEQNITTLHDFRSKWLDMLPSTLPVPTPATEANVKELGVYEGAGYQSKGVYRPMQDCRMKTNSAPAFCPVCQRAIARMILWHCEEN